MGTNSPQTARPYCLGMPRFGASAVRDRSGTSPGTAGSCWSGCLRCRASLPSPCLRVLRLVGQLAHFVRLGALRLGTSRHSHSGKARSRQPRTCNTYRHNPNLHPHPVPACANSPLVSPPMEIHQSVKKIVGITLQIWQSLSGRQVQLQELG